MNKYFEINIKNKKLGKLSFYFYLLDEPYKEVIAEDDFGNKIINNKNGVFLYVHDADESCDCLKLFDNIDLFYKNTEFHETDKRFNDDEPLEFNQYHKEDIQPRSIYISQFVKYLGGNRLVDKYKDGNQYNISQAYIDDSITKEEYILLSHL